MGNPSCLEILYTEPEDHVFVSDLGQIMLDNRDAFLSKLVKGSYIGYAKGQAHRIIQHRKYLLNPFDHKPTREESGLNPVPKIEKKHYDAIKSLINAKIEQWRPDFSPLSDIQKVYMQGKIADILTEMNITSDDKWAAAARTIGLDENLVQIMKEEKQYENKVHEYENYLKWKAERNPKRASLETKYGFDCKHGSHLIRLLRMGKEILETGIMQVKRKEDREELIAIKQGAWTYDQLISYADKIEDEVKDAYNKSKLPNTPNINLLDKLCIEIIEKSLMNPEMEDYNFSIIIGADCVNDFERWKNYEELANSVPFVIVPRKGYELDSYKGILSHFPHIRK